jgi:hypothetical protein
MSEAFNVMTSFCPLHPSNVLPSIRALGLLAAPADLQDFVAVLVIYFGPFTERIFKDTQPLRRFLWQFRSAGHLADVIKARET